MTDSTTTPQPNDAPRTTDKLILCPYCGSNQRGGDRCNSCGGLFEPLSQVATQIAMGPWYIRDRNNPFRPGCSYEVLTQMVKAGRIKPTTVLRGPSTRQFWSVARNVEGISHLLGYCHSCHAHVDPADTSCASCGAAFKPIPTRDQLGLRFKTPADAARARAELDAQVEEVVTGHPRRKPRRRAISDQLTGDKPIQKTAGLLEDVLEMDDAHAHGGHDGETLNFAPSDDSGPGEAPLQHTEPAPAADGGSSKLLVALWVLGILNILTAGGLFLMWSMLYGSPLGG